MTLFESLLPRAGFFEDEATAFSAAFREAVDNAIRHGNRGRPDLRVDVRCTLAGRMLEVRVADQGKGFDYDYYLSLIHI